MEYLQGRALTNAVGNLDVQDAYANAMKQLGYALEEITEQVIWCNYSACKRFSHANMVIQQDYRRVTWHSGVLFWLYSLGSTQFQLLCNLAAYRQVFRFRCVECGCGKHWSWIFFWYFCSNIYFNRKKMLHLVMVVLGGSLLVFLTQWLLWAYLHGDMVWGTDMVCSSNWWPKQAKRKLLKIGWRFGGT